MVETLGRLDWKWLIRVWWVRMLHRVSVGMNTVEEGTVVVVAIDAQGSIRD